MLNLSKGGNLNLAKECAGISVFKVGLGQDVHPTAGKEFDLDAIAIPLDSNGKVVDQNAMIFYNNLQWKDCIKHSGDNRTGAGAGDDETITIDTSKVPANIESIEIFVNIHDARNRQQNFGMVNNAGCRLYADNSTTPIAKFDLTEDASMSRCIVFCKLYKHNGEWKFKALETDKGSYQNTLLKDVLEGYGFTGVKPAI